MYLLSLRRLLLVFCMPRLFEGYVHVKAEFIRGRGLKCVKRTTIGSPGVPGTFNLVAVLSLSFASTYLFRQAVILLFNYMYMYFFPSSWFVVMSV